MVKTKGTSRVIRPALSELRSSGICGCSIVSPFTEDVTQGRPIKLLFSLSLSLVPLPVVFQNGLTTERAHCRSTSNPFETEIPAFVTCVVPDRKRRIRFSEPTVSFTGKIPLFVCACTCFVHVTARALSIPQKPSLPEGKVGQSPTTRGRRGLGRRAPGR